MIKKNSKKVVIILSVFVSFFSINGISNRAANIASFIVATLSGTGSYKAWRDIPDLQMIHSVFFIGTPLIITGAAYHFFHSITPAGRIKKANILLSRLSRHKLVKISFDNDSDFFDAIYNKFLREDLPLISAYKYFVSLLPDMYSVFRLIKKAKVGACGNQVLKKKYSSSLLCSKKLFRNITRALKRIREHKDYLPQLTLHKEFLNSTKQTIAQEQMAQAQIQMAHAQQGFVVLKWIKAILPALW